MIIYGLILINFAMLGCFLTVYSKHEWIVCLGVGMVIACTLVYLVMFILYCIWNKEGKKECD